MAKQAGTDSKRHVQEITQSLVDLSTLDTVYGDVYLRRAREVIAPVLSRAEYQALKNVGRDIDAGIKESKAATMRQDWQRVATLTAQVEGLRQRAHDSAALSALGEKIYEGVGVSIDPFSPGFESLPGHQGDVAEQRDAVLEKLKKLAAADAERATFYETRRAFFAGFSILPKRGAAKTASAPATGTAELQQLAAQAAQQGDMAQLRRYAQDLVARQAQEGAAPAAQSSAPKPAVDTAAFRCPVDLTAPLPSDVAERARTLGLAVVRTEPLAQAAPLFEYVTTHIWQPELASESEHEGTMRIAAVVDEAGFPKDVSESVRVLIAQFLRNPFINSGGARYLPQFNAETVLIEDFPEDRESPAPGELLSALGLSRRRGLARLEIDDALQEHGAAILAERLHLDPLEFRLVCIPQDLYMRFGRDHGWGQQQQWTHFDGYQVLKSGALRALVGGDVRHGGLSDLLSLGITDRRECVVVRFAVVRRARQVARWR